AGAAFQGATAGDAVPHAACPSSWPSCPRRRQARLLMVTPGVNLRSSLVRVTRTDMRVQTELAGPVHTRRSVMSAHLDLQEGKEGRTTTLFLAGELDLSTAPELEVAVRRLCRSDIPDEVILDLSDVSFIDTAGVRVIVACKQLLGAHDCGFSPLSPSATARPILEPCRSLELL